MAMRDRDHRTDTMEPYEPSDEAYDWDYEGEPSPHHPATILWGRVAVLGAAILVAFLLGRMTAGGGVPQEDLDRVRAERDDAQAQVADLQAEVDGLTTQLEEAQAAGTDPEADTGAATGDTTDDTDGTDTGTQAQSEAYVVEPGDSLRSIAEEFYGDVGLWTLIAEENNMTSTSVLQAGDEILIPPEPPAEEQ
jgi:hypothetical protein